MTIIDADVEHGRSGYNWRGCRCDICTEGQRAYIAEQRARRGRIPRHGTRAEYQRHGCRCDDCTAANSRYMANYKRANALEVYAREGIVGAVPTFDNPPCAGLASIMFPDDGSADHRGAGKAGRRPDNEAKWAKARAVCAECTDRAACAEFGIVNFYRVPHGMWGGMTPNERRNALRVRRSWK